MESTRNHSTGQPRALTIRGILVGIAVVGGVALASAMVQAADIVVPRDFPTIQAAVNAAPAGATIKVRRGTYTEEIVIAKDLILKGAGVDGRRFSVLVRWGSRSSWVRWRG